MKDILDLAISIFKNFSVAELNSITDFLRVLTFTDKQVVIEQGQANLKVYYILQGVAVVSKLEPSGHSVLIAVLGVGDTFGEISVLTKKPTTASIIGQQNLKVLEIDVGGIIEHNKEPALLGKLIVNLTDSLSSKLESSKTIRIAAEEPTTILNLFGWKWKDILHEIPFLAEHGYDAIKLYPVSEFVVRKGDPWWAIYQPVSYFLSDYWGSCEDLKSLIHLAHSFGIKVYVDVVGNHMATADQDEIEWKGTNGHTFTPYNYPCINCDNDAYTKDDFVLHEGKEIAISNQDYTKLERIWHLEHYTLLGLPKLNYEKEHVKNVLRKYVNFLLSLGIDGFRVDAAKHLNITNAKYVYENLLTSSGSVPFIYQEYFLGSPEGIDVKSYMEKYFSLGFVTCFYYGIILSDSILKRNGNCLQKLVEFSLGTPWVGFPNNRAVVVLDNHDTERYVSDGLNYKNSPNNAYVIGYIFMLAWPFGIPKIMSSFKFSEHDDGFPKDCVWKNEKITCFDPDSKWVAQHRWNAIANMVLFRKKTKNATGITHKWLNGDQVAFARTLQIPKRMQYTTGFVVINNTSDVLVNTFETGLPDGRYADMISSVFKDGIWIGPKVDVFNFGMAEIRVDPFSAVVLCIDCCE
ncbi:MAG: cyclic nucleotide-binding domain-containing protein [Chlamydiae bacterium]|nr:cyclic nucleotide-binding domain-containing protein [Chlamydiota bacterium]